MPKVDDERVTYADLQQLPWSRPRDWELFDGRLVTPERLDSDTDFDWIMRGRFHPLRRRAMTRRRFDSFLTDICWDADLRLQTGVHWYVDEHNVYRPDFVVLNPDATRDRRCLREPPLLAVDVLVPPIQMPDPERLDAYANGGLRYYWVIDPDVPSIALFELVSGTYKERANVRQDDVLKVTQPFPVELWPNGQVSDK